MKKLFLVSLILFISSCSLNSVKENIDSPNFKDGIFHNLDPNKNRKRGYFRFLCMRIKTDWSDWPYWVSTDEVVNLKSREFSEKIKVSWINHSTFLIQTQGLNIITDPIFSERASPVSFAGPKRVHKPSISLTNLPKIDIVIISHDHYDHLDLDSINTIIERDNPKVYLGLGVKKRLE
ncbi:MAG: MBL fold metallo-hydrolase, partial [Gammaproteobacteria bacterium]